MWLIFCPVSFPTFFGCLHFPSNCRHTKSQPLTLQVAFADHCGDIRPHEPILPLHAGPEDPIQGIQERRATHSSQSKPSFVFLPPMDLTTALAHGMHLGIGQRETRSFLLQERLVAIFHAVFALTFAARIVPQTIWTVHLLFGPSFAVQFDNVRLPISLLVCPKTCSLTMQ